MLPHRFMLLTPLTTSINTESIGLYRDNGTSKRKSIKLC